MLPPIPLRKAVVNTTDRPGLPNVYGLHHWAFRCRDAEETRCFYEDILGLPLAAAVFHEHVPSTGEFHPYYHIFFEMADGSYLAFFDLLDGKPYTPDPASPPWLHHMSLEVDNHQSLLDAKTRLETHGVEVLGVIDHGWFDSIYFFDPNGMRMEFSFRKASLKDMEGKAAAARKLLADRPEIIRKYKEQGAIK